MEKNINDFVIKSIPCNFLKTTSLIYEGRKDENQAYIFETSGLVFNDIQINEDFIPLGIFNIRGVTADSNFTQTLFYGTHNPTSIAPLQTICTETFETQINDIWETVFVVNTHLNAKLKRLLSLKNVLHGLNIDYSNLMLQPQTFKPVLYVGSFGDNDIQNNKQTFELLYLTKP